MSPASSSDRNEHIGQDPLGEVLIDRESRPSAHLTLNSRRKLRFRLGGKPPFYLKPLRVGDTQTLLHLLRSEVSAKHFTLTLLYNQLDDPQLMTFEELASWPDQQLIHIARRWMLQLTDSEQDIGRSLDAYDNFREGMQSYIDDFARRIAMMTQPVVSAAADIAKQGRVAIPPSQLATISHTLNSFLANIASAIEPMIVTINRLSEQAISALDTLFERNDFFARLPDLSDLIRNMAELEEGRESLAKFGFDFSYPLLTQEMVRSFRETHPKTMGATTINRLVNITRQDEFLAGMESTIPSSTTLKRRWRVIRHAYLAHVERNYALAIPALLAQLEGIVGDGLILKGVAIPSAGRLYVRDPMTRSIKIGKDGKHVEVNGLKDAVDRSALHRDPRFRSLADVLSNSLAPNRNSILHGRTLNYDKAKYSVETLLALVVMAQAVSDYEQGNSI